MKVVRGYHFTNGNKLRDGREVPPVGEWLVHKGIVRMCRSGLHASEHPIDALHYAPGPTLHLVELSGTIKRSNFDEDKLVASHRRVLATIDATSIINEALAYWRFSTELWSAQWHEGYEYPCPDLRTLVKRRGYRKGRHEFLCAVEDAFTRAGAYG
jgi:hypothetical protein